MERNLLTRYLLRRLLSSAITIAVMAVLVFFASRVLPGDPAVIRAGNDATPELIARIRAEHGLDLPLYEQFFHYVGGLLHGDLGTSVRTGNPVSADLLTFLPATLELSLLAFVVAVLIGVTVGTVAAARAGRWPDAVARGFTAVGGSMPSFWLALMAIFVLVYSLGLFPSPVGRLPLGTSAPPRHTGFLTIDALIAGDSALATSALAQLALPALLLGTLSSIALARITRTAMIDALSASHTRAARGLNLGRRHILLQEGFRNALPTIITSMGFVAGHLIAGNIIVEQIFSWPGIGRYLSTAISQSDLDVVQGFVIVVGVSYVLINLVVDLLYVVSDPRIDLRRAG
ncbi:ABC transporter permease [Polymorphospora lycopeni]|uniref:ABC transporter permease n=1 Tax=Polymorphospora lycopeni TaxID=3140240 RepID=A0ABV5CT86_9ACTN